MGVKGPGARTTIEDVGGGWSRAVLWGQVAPGRSRGQDPQDAIDDPPMRLAGTPDSGLLRRQERSQSVPLGIGEVMSAHTPQLTPVCGQALVEPSRAGGRCPT